MFFTVTVILQQRLDQFNAGAADINFDNSIFPNAYGSTLSSADILLSRLALLSSLTFLTTFLSHC